MTLKTSSGHALLRLFRSRIRRQRKAQLILLAKATIFQIFSVLMTFLLAFLFTHDVDISLSLSAYDIILKIVLYYVFDVSWTRLFNHF
jgi:uncharacterized membrane protein